MDRNPQFDELRRYRILIGVAKEGIWTLDANNLTDFINESGAALLGHKPEEMFGRPMADFVSPEDMGQLKEWIPGQFHKCELRMRRPDGAKIWILLSASPFNDEHGDHEGSLILFTDITEHKLVEEKNAYLANLLDCVTDAIITVDERSLITTWNRAAESIYGYNADEAIGKQVVELLDTEFVGEDLILATKAMESGAWKGEVIQRRKDGTRLIIYSSVSRISVAGKPPTYVAVNRDVTKDRKIDEALKESEAKYRGLFENLEESVSVFREVRDDKGELVDGLFLDVNPATCRNTGRSYPELVGRTFDQVFGEGAAEMYIPNVKEMRAKNAPVMKTYSLGTPDGQYLNIFVPLSEDTYLISTMDVTEIKKAQKKAEELTNNLKRSNAELLQFAYVASHDLREPLRMITSYLGLLEQKYKDQLDAKAQEYILFAVNGGERMQLLIDDLLAYSRVDTRAKAFTPVDMNKVLDGVIKVLEVPIRENKAEIQVQLLPTINADESQMFQLMQNLLDNAIKFHGKDAPMISVWAVQKGKEWTFAVKDNGIGMNTSQSDKIFQMFQRLHGPGEYPGTGIGLAIAKKIVERHNGRIWVESEPGKGSTFFYTIPVASRA